MKRLAAWLLVLVVGVIIGLGSALFPVLNMGAAHALKVGAWQVSTLAGSPKADAYTRAAVALGGLLALSPEEAIYFTADRDDEGKLLTSNCDYEVTGGDFDSQWWSVTAYGADRFLIPNEAHVFSFNGSTISRAAGQPWTINASANRKPQNWLPVPQKPGHFFLALRLYRPGAGITQALDKVAVPHINRGTCA